MADNQRMHHVSQLVDDELVKTRRMPHPADVYGGTSSEIARHPLTPKRPKYGPLKQITLEEAGAVLFRLGYHLTVGQKDLSPKQRAVLKEQGYVVASAPKKGKKKKASKKTAAKKTATKKARKTPKKRKTAKKTATAAATPKPKKTAKKGKKKAGKKKAGKKTATKRTRKTSKKRKSPKKSAATTGRTKISHTAAVEKAKALSPSFVGKGGRILKPGHEALACAGFEVEPKQKGSKRGGGKKRGGKRKSKKS